MEPKDERAAIETRKQIEQLSSPDQLDSLLVVTSLRTWVALTATSSVLIVLILWVLFGSIPVRVSGKGLMMNRNGLFDVQSQIGGLVQEILVNSGDTFEKDQVLARVGDPQIVLKLKAAQHKVVTLRGNLAVLQEQVKSEDVARREALQREREAALFVIQEAESELPGLQLSLVKKQELLQEGLITQQAVNDAQHIVNAKEIELDSAKAKIKSVDAELAKNYRSEEAKAKAQELAEATRDEELLSIQTEYGSVRAPRAGRILEVIANTGEVVQTGATLLWAEATPVTLENQVVYGYVPVEIGKRMTPGLPVIMEMATVNAEEYGYMRGIVSEVSRFPVSPRSLVRTIHNDQLVRFLVGDAATVQLIIEPVHDASTTSGFSWTSSEGAPFQISTGTVCTLKATVEYVRPLYYLFPLKRFVTSGAERAPEHSGR